MKGSARGRVSGLTNVSGWDFVGVQMIVVRGCRHRCNGQLESPQRFLITVGTIDGCPWLVMGIISCESNAFRMSRSHSLVDFSAFIFTMISSTGLRLRLLSGFQPSVLLPKPKFRTPSSRVDQCKVGGYVSRRRHSWAIPMTCAA